jgi:hypothetical protein
MTKPTTTQPSVLARLRAIAPARGLDRATAFRVAEHQAKLLLELTNTTAAPVPLDVLRRVPVIELAVVADLPASGASYWTGEVWRLEVAADDHTHRQRFTFCHEFKHVIDHHVRDLLYANGRIRERVADHFAACLLMPRRDLIHAWRAGEQDIEHLARHFAVSTAAMARRLTTLGLLRRRTATRTQGGRGIRPTLRPKRSFAIAGRTSIGDLP